MSNYNQNNSGKKMDGDRFRGKRTIGGRFDRRNPGRSEMFPATCDKCGKSCHWSNECNGNFTIKRMGD